MKFTMLKPKKKPDFLNDNLWKLMLKLSTPSILGMMVTFIDKLDNRNFQYYFFISFLSSIIIFMNHINFKINQ